MTIYGRFAYLQLQIQLKKLRCPPGYIHFKFNTKLQNMFTVFNSRPPWDILVTLQETSLISDQCVLKVRVFKKHIVNAGMPNTGEALADNSQVEMQ